VYALDARSSFAMSDNIDILLQLPDVAAIGSNKLQDFCSE
jgi:hypothetical protein